MLVLLLQKYPPYISSNIPFLGHALAFGKSPIEFLENAYEKVSMNICYAIFDDLNVKFDEVCIIILTWTWITGRKLQNCGLPGFIGH